MAGASASATTLMNGSAGDTAAAASAPRLPVSRTQRPRTDPVDSGGHLVHWLVAAHFSVTAFRARTVLLAGTVLLVDESGPALAARVAVSGLSCHGHVLPRTLTALLQARRPLGRPPVRCAPSPHRTRGARRPPNRAGANTEHGMPIDGDLSRLLVSSMIALPGSPIQANDRRAPPHRS
jgi:hypothetical protein